MIVSFSVANFRSFNSEVTLSFVASKRLAGEHDSHTAEIPGTSDLVLRTSVLYGANGAGKSNLFAALELLQNIAVRTNEKGASIRRTPFKLARTSSEPTSFDLQFIASEKLYRFGLKFDGERILEEWLLVYSGHKEKTLYERSVASGVTSIEVPNGALLKGAGDRLKPLSEFGSPPNQTFLATVAANLEEAEYGEHLTAVIQWFERLTLISPRHEFGHLPTVLLKNEKLKSFAGEFLRNCSTGVDAVGVQRTPMSESYLNDLVPSEFAPKLLEELKSGSHLLGLIPNRGELVADEKNKDELYRVSIQTNHTTPTGETVTFELDEESDGTKRLLDLLPALYYCQQREAVFFIDEIDRSLHPNLIKYFMEYFLKSCSGGRHQIIVTTHESNLLDLKLLRRDEIWFTEKDTSGATQLYSLADFKVRKDLEIRKGYLAGRFGAIPFLGDIEALGENEGGDCADTEEGPSDTA